MSAALRFSTITPFDSPQRIFARLYDCTGRVKAVKWHLKNFQENHVVTCVFIQLRCNPGKTYEVADAIYEREIVSEMYSTSGDFDLMLKVYIEKGEDVGKFVNEKILDIPGIQRSLTTITFKAF